MTLRPLAPVTASRGTWTLLLQAALLLVAVRLMLWALPSGVVLRATFRLATCTERLTRRGRRGAVAIAAAVRAASCYVPHATCLTQAVAAQLLLARYGFASHLRLGVARDPAGAFQAHAWVERAGEVVIGGDRPVDAYVSLSRLGVVPSTDHPGTVGP